MKISEKLITGLTVDEKIECYKKVLDEFGKKDNVYGICGELDVCFDDWLDFNTYEPIYKLFPELLTKKSPPKSECPGVSTMLMRKSLY